MFHQTQQQKQRSKKLQIFEHQVSGKNPKFTDKQRKYVYKISSQTQKNYFQFLKNQTINDSSYQLSKYLPTYLGVYTQKQILQQNNLSQQQQTQKQHPSTSTSNYIYQDSQISEQKKQWIDHISKISRRFHNIKNQDILYIKLKNLIYGMKQPNIIDLKLGIKKFKSDSKKFKNCTTISHKVRINGMSIRQYSTKQQQNQLIKPQKNPHLISHHQQSKRQQNYFLSKYYCQQIPLSLFPFHLSFFFFNGKKLLIPLLQHIIFHLKEIYLSIKTFKNIKFYSSSIYIAYDFYNPQKYTINLIDFDRLQMYEDILQIDDKEKQDRLILEGIKNTIEFLNDIRINKKYYQKQLLEKNMKQSIEQHQVIPKNKRVQ